MSFSSGVAYWDISSWGLTKPPKAVLLTGASHYTSYSAFDSELTAKRITVRDGSGNSGNYSVWYIVVEAD